MSNYHPAIASLMQYFAYTHLSKEKQEIIRPFCNLALELADRSPENPETTTAIRKLLEAKDAAERAGQ